MTRRSNRWVRQKKGNQVFRRDPRKFFFKVHFKLIYIFLHVVNLKTRELLINSLQSLAILRAFFCDDAGNEHL